MKCLHVTCRQNDYLSALTLHGLVKVLGADNIVVSERLDIMDDYGNNPCSRIIFEGDVNCEYLMSKNTVYHCKSLFAQDTEHRKVWSQQQDGFDLLVLHAAFLRERSWSWLLDEIMPRLKPDAKIAYVEGWDADYQVEEPPCLPGYTAFRREVNPRLYYPYHPNCLMFSAPQHWQVDKDDWSRERSIDVFYAGAVMASPERWQCLSKMFQTKTQWKIIGASCGLGFQEYFPMLRQTKLAVCPVGAGGCFDCLRTWEAVAAGCLPVFVGWPDRTREPWFPDDLCFVCRTVDELPATLDRVLGMDDLAERRRRLWREVAERHTTTVRARRILELAGVKP